MCGDIVSMKNGLYPNIIASSSWHEAFHSRWESKKKCLWKGAEGGVEWRKSQQEAQGEFFSFSFCLWAKVIWIWSSKVHKISNKSCHWYFKSFCLNYCSYEQHLPLLDNRDANIYMIYWYILKVKCLPSVWNCKFALVVWLLVFVFIAQVNNNAV